MVWMDPVAHKSPHRPKVAMADGPEPGWQQEAGEAVGSSKSNSGDGYEFMRSELLDSDTYSLLKVLKDIRPVLSTQRIKLE
jgi:hypothetical protein